MNENKILELKKFLSSNPQPYEVDSYLKSIREDSVPMCSGRWIEEIYNRKKSGDSLVKVSEYEIEKPNHIMTANKALLAGLMANESTFVGGILYMALGHGDVAWDTSGPPAPTLSDITLLDEYFRKVVDSIIYIDDAAVQIPLGKTSVHRIQIQCTYDYGEAIGSIREIGTFGGDATATADSGYISSLYRKIETYKETDDKIIYKCRLRFN